MSTARHFLDYNHEYWIDLDYDAIEKKLVTTIGSRTEPWPRLVKSLAFQLQLANSETSRPKKLQTFNKPYNERTFTNVTPKFNLYLGHEQIGEYELGENNLTECSHRYLTVDETRRMGTFHNTAPYQQHHPELNAEENQVLLDLAKKAVFTDIHTHSSGQITAKGLLSLALEHEPYDYPVRLLEEAGIDTHHIKRRVMIPRIPFTPTEPTIPGVIYPEKLEAVALQELTEADRLKLIERMSLPISRQSTFTEMEKDGYRFRYPFTKDPNLIEGTQRKTAEESMVQGLKYITPSYVGLEKPAIYKAVHTVMNELEQTHVNFKQRYMVGIPRGISLEQMKEYLEKAKILLDSPYVVGVDMLGFESNKTKEFVEAVDEFCTWANEHKPGATIRFHAGENDKNLDNVNDFLKMAVKHDHLMFSVGHGLYGIDETTTRYARTLCADPQHPRLLIEFNPSSNIALDNIDDVRQIPFDWAINNHIPFIVSSDSAGMYQTSPEQLGLAAHAAGMEAKGFELLKQHQEYIMKHQLAFCAKNAKAVQDNATFVEQTAKRLEAAPKAQTPATIDSADSKIEQQLKSKGTKFISADALPAELSGKTPIIFMGASGESWKRIPPKQQREYAIAVDMMLHTLGDNCYIVQGRRKDSGLSHVINESLERVNIERSRNGQPPMMNLGMYAGPFEAGKSYTNFTHMLRIPGSSLNLPDAIADYALTNNGIFVAVGGATFTRNTISKADQRGIRDPEYSNMMILMSPSSTNLTADELFTLGASAQKAQVLNPQYRTRDGKEAVQKLFKHYRTVFPPSFSPEQLEELYIASSKRVDSYKAVITESSCAAK